MEEETMKIRNSLLFGFIGSVLIACGGADSSPTPSTCDNANLAVPVTGSAITVKFTVANLPETLPVNMPSSSDGLAEYLWSVLFDIDDNGITSSGDIQFNLQHIKWPGSQSIQCKISDFEATVFEFISETSARQITNGAVEVMGNTITLKIPKSQHAALSNIDNTIKVQFRTIGHDDTGQPYGDAYPVVDSQGTFISIPLNGMFEDTDTSMGELLGIDLRYIDLQIMEVIID